MNIIKIAFLLLLATSSIINGQNSFQKFFGELKAETYIQDVCVNDNNYSIILYDGKFSLTKISQWGDLLNQDTIEISSSSGVTRFNRDYYPTKFISDGDIAVIGTYRGNNTDTLYLSIFDQSLNLINKEIIDIIGFVPNPSCVVYFIEPSMLLIFYKYSPDLFELKIFEKINFQWKFKSGKSFVLRSSSFFNFAYVTSDKNKNIYISSPKQITKLSPGLDTLWTKRFNNQRIQKLIPESDNLLIVFNESFSLYDSLGQELWTVTPEQWIQNIGISGQDEILLTGEGISTYSLEGNLLEEFNANFYIDFVKRLKNGNIFYSGGNFLAVTGPDGTLQKELVLTSQKQSAEYFTSDKIGITWYNIGNENVNIYYSTDSGSLWNEIVNYYPADDRGYSWSPPYEEMDNLKFKVAAYDNEEIYDISDSVISIKIFDEYTALSGNNIYMWLGNNGLGSHDPVNGNEGMFWPGGMSESVNVIYADGLVWGGKVNDEIRVNGNTYRNGLQPGKILDDGTADYPYQSKYKIYKLKNRWEYLPAGPERDRYKYDYMNWPGNLGAPFADIDNDGIFTPGIDEPEIIGEETVFYIANDLDTAACRSTYGSDPIGMEFTTTAYAYKYPLDNVVFKDYVIVNKSGEQIKDMYFAYWADIEIGWAEDDFIGCEPALDLAYGYNSDNYDDDHYGALPPAVGHMLLQGPIDLGSEKDSAKFMGRTVRGYKNLRMTAFTPNFKNFADLPNDPRVGDYEGSLEFYDIMHGLSEKGDSIVNPNTDKGTVFPLSGDPEKGTGWYEGAGWPDGPAGGDRRYTLSTGPFDMMPGDTQNVVIAILIERGTDNINSVTALKESAKDVQEWWGNEIITSVESSDNLVNEFKLKQNYPNPFNPTTTIEYTIPALTPFLSLRERVSAGQVRVVLNVIDILGREVATLVDKHQKPGIYKVLFDGTQLSSGVYFYNIRYGDKSISKKMLLVK